MAGTIPGYADELLRVPGAARFAVLDVETTGFNARGSDRIVEVAVITLGMDGQVVDEFATLVNPCRDVGPTHVHGITASDVASAPTFADVVGDVIQRLRGAVVAGHNVGFDERFLRAECDRLHLALPAFPTVCTLRLSALLDLPSISRSLEDCCAAVGHELRAAHSALGDAHATAALLLACLDLARGRDVGLRASLVDSERAGDGTWPQSSPSGRCLRREAARQARESEVSFLARLVAALPHDSSLSGDATVYLATLDRALGDRRVTQQEADALLAIAQENGLSWAEAQRLHRVYLGALCRAAQEDGIVTAAERLDLESVTRLLGLTPVVLAAELEAVESVRPAPSAGSETWKREYSRDRLAGKTVCFTGELSGCISGEPVTREQAESLAGAAGLKVARGVTKKLDYLVVADPDTMSGKARKARAYGTTIIAESVFWSALGVRVE